MMATQVRTTTFPLFDDVFDEQWDAVAAQPQAREVGYSSYTRSDGRIVTCC